ncbi:MAG: DUF4097 family beta strand repeat-containing protein [Acidimicrobiales bacterium]
MAAGRMSPEEAARLLTGEEHHPVRRVSKVRLEGTFRAARVVGDASVEEVVVDGPHIVHRDGNALVITSEADETISAAFSFGRAAFAGYGTRDARFGRVPLAWLRAGFPSASLADLAPLSELATPLLIRINPHIAFEADLATGSVAVSELSSHVAVRVSAGSASLERLAGSCDVDVKAGSLRFEGSIGPGQRCRLRCEAGSVSVQLPAEGSNVKVRARTSLGRLVLDGIEDLAAWSVDQERELVLGDGAGSLEAESLMGLVQVAVGLPLSHQPHEDR